MGFGWGIPPTLELLLIRCAFGVYVVVFITSNMLLMAQKKKMTLMEFATHAVYILLMSRLIRISESIPSAGEMENYNYMTVIVATCVACFLLGIFVGRSWALSSTIESKDNASKVAGKDSVAATNGSSSRQDILERKIKLKPRGDNQKDHAEEGTQTGTAVVSNQIAARITANANGGEVVLGDTHTQGINYRPPFADDTYKGILEKAKATVMSVVGLLSHPGCTDIYTKCQWTVIRSATSANLWVSKSKSDGILLRATSLVNTPAKSVMKWILHNDLAVGIESLSFRKETLKTFKGENARLRRLSCKSGSLTSSKRDFVFISGSSSLADGTIILASRSLQVPQEITPNMRKANKHGFIRGILHGSGFILRPIRCIDSGGFDMCEVFFAVHVDMLGSASGRVNESKREVLADFVLQIMDHLKSGAANYFNNDTTEVNMHSDHHDFFEDDEDDHLPSTSKPAPTNSALPKTKEEEDIANNARALGLDAEQVSEIVATSENAVNHLKELYASKCAQGNQSTNTKSRVLPSATSTDGLGSISGFAANIQLNKGDDTSDAGSVTSPIGWDTFYDNDGITVSEQTGSNRPVGTLNAFCSLEASPQTIRTLLVEHQDQIDGLLAGKSVLHKIDKHAYVQWLAYRAIWPLGARDFLLVTAEKRITNTGDVIGANNGDNNENGFLVVSTSIDDICEEIDEAEFDPSFDGTNASSLLADKSKKIAEFSRSKIRLAGYIGMPSKTIPGGTDLSLFVDIDVYSYTPAWLVQVLAQYGLAEMMGRIRRATMGQSSSSQQSQLNTILSRIHTWESRLQLFRDGDTSQPAVLFPLHSPQSSSHKKVETADSALTPSTPTTKKQSASADREQANGNSNSSDGDSRANSTTDSSVAGVTGEAVSFKLVADAEVAVSGVAPVPVPARVERSPGQQLADRAIILLQKFLGILSSTELELDWQVKVSKTNITVETSKVAGSTWQAIRAKTTMTADKATILKLLIDDDRIGEFDDMFDFYKFLVKVDENTAVRRVCFKGIWPTAPRDFVVCTTWTERPDGSIMIVSRSAPEDYCAQQKGYVRGFIQVSGYLITPFDGGCNVTLAAHTELGGSLPASVVNMLSTSAPVKMLQTISDLVKR